MAKYTIYRDDYCYPIKADTFEELQKLRAKGNRSFMSHGYGSVCEYVEFNETTHRYSTKYFDIYTGEEVSETKRGW